MPRSLQGPQAREVRFVSAEHLLPLWFRVSFLCADGMLLTTVLHGRQQNKIFASSEQFPGSSSMPASARQPGRLGM